MSRRSRTASSPACRRASSKRSRGCSRSGRTSDRRAASSCARCSTATRQIPPRGRPGITIPPNVALPGAPPPSAHPPSQPPGPTHRPQVETAADATQVNTAHMPTHLPTAQMPPPGQTRAPAATSFSPTAQMPTARPPQQTTEFDPSLAPRGPASLPPPMPPAGRPRADAGASQWPASRPATLPPPVSRSTVVRRRWPRSRSPSRRAAVRRRSPRRAAIPVAKTGGSRAGLIIAGVVGVLVVAAAAAWQFAPKDKPGRRRSDPGRGQRRGRAAGHRGRDAATRRPPRPRRRPPAPVAATVTPPAATGTASTDAPHGTRRSAGGAGPSDDRQPRPSPVVVPDAAKPVPPPARPVPTTARSDAPTDPVARPSTAAVATDRTVPAPTTASASAAKPRPSGQPVPRETTTAGDHRTGDDHPAARAGLDLRQSLRHARHQHRRGEPVRAAASGRPAGAS